MGVIKAVVAKRKKGMFYTLTAIIILGFLLALTAVPTLISTDQNTIALTNRLQSINSFVANVQTDAEIAIYTSGFRTMIALIENIESNGDYISDIDTSSQTLLINGTLSGNPIFVMENNTLADWMNRIELEANNLGIQFNSQIVDTQIFQHDPWAVSFNVTFEMLYNDSRSGSYWNVTYLASTDIPLEGFSDPFYIIETNNLFPNVINQSIYDGVFVNNSNVDNLTDHLENGYYITFAAAPNYLNRLQGIFSASNETGIESLVDKSALSAVYPIDATKSNVDYIYFDSSSPFSYEFDFMPASFWLDNTSSQNVSHIERYNLSNLVK